MPFNTLPISSSTMLSANQLLDALLERARGVTASETVPVTNALGRVLAVPQTSAITVPPLDNSAMDGYAVRVADVAVAGMKLPVSQRILAGTVGQPLQPGTAARIFTGAPVKMRAAVPGCKGWPTAPARMRCDTGSLTPAVPTSATRTA